MTRDYLSTPAAQREIARRLGEQRPRVRRRPILFLVGGALLAVVLVVAR